MVQSMGKSSAWSRQKEIVLNDRDHRAEDEVQTIKSNGFKIATTKSKQLEKPNNSDQQATDDVSVVAEKDSGNQQSMSVQEQHDAVAEAEINDAAVNHETEAVDGADAENGDFKTQQMKELTTFQPRRTVRSPMV